VPIRKKPSSLLVKIAKGIRRPGDAVRYFRRSWRNRRITRIAQNDHVAFYRQVMADDVARKTPYGAVGTEDHDAWLALGNKQFTYLRARGLRPDHRMLEIGCGNLRAGWRFIEFLAEGAYTGVDISPEILLAAQDTLVERALQAKRPHLMIVNEMTFKALPDDHFDVVHAHSVFSHTPVEIIEAAFMGVRRVIREDGFFDFTFNESADGRHWGALREDYFYPVEMLIGLAADRGFEAEKMEGWAHPQAKLRLRPR
jgi:SAM-dependent methyltransferase